MLINGTDYIDASDVLPASLRYDLQPYGVKTVSNLVQGFSGQDNKYPCLHGVVIEGFDINRLGGHTSRTSAVGHRVTIYGFTKRDLERANRGEIIVRVAM